MGSAHLCREARSDIRRSDGSGAQLKTSVGTSGDEDAATKKLLHQTWVADEDTALIKESRLQALILAGKNQRAAMKASFQKSAPAFGKRLLGL